MSDSDDDQKRVIPSYRSAESVWDADAASLTRSASAFVNHRRQRERRTRQIVSGDRYPSITDLLAGLPPHGDNLEQDIAMFVARAASSDLSDPVREALRHFETLPQGSTASRLWRLTQDERGTALIRYRSIQLCERAAWYAAMFGDWSAKLWLSGFHYEYTSFDDALYRRALLSSSLSDLDGPDEWQPDWQLYILNHGRDLFLYDASRSFEEEFWATRHGLAERIMKGEVDDVELLRIRFPNVEIITVVAADPTPDLETEFTFLAEQETDLPQVSAPEKFGLVVITEAPEAYTNDQKSFVKPFLALKNKSITLGLADNPSVVEADIGARWPHATDVVRRLLGDLQPGKPIRFRPTLLVGEPGGGKTRLLTTLAQALGLASIVYPCASVADSSFGGTPAQWSSRRTSTPLQAIRQYGIANPLIVLDELEKSGQGSHNGSLVHTLLPLLESHSASHYWETALEVPVNLSAVNFLATANNLREIPEPLRDRFRILRMRDATVEHLPTLATQVLADMSADTGYPIEPLEEDELYVIAKVWSGGSLRKLKSAIVTTIEVRARTRVLN